MKTTKPILPCPFCGRPGQLEENQEFSRSPIEYAVTCLPSYAQETCIGKIEYNRDGQFTRGFSTPEEAIKAWNKRPAK